MYRTTDSKGNPIAIKFRHHGGRKGTKDIPGKPPRYTSCRIVSADEVLGEAIAKPVSEVPVLAGTDAQVKALFEEHGKHVRRVLRTEGDVRVVILRGDQFSRAEGRSESLKKAMAKLDTGTQANIKKAVLG